LNGTNWKRKKSKFVENICLQGQNVGCCTIKMPRKRKIWQKRKEKETKFEREGLRGTRKDMGSGQGVTTGS